ncbi:MAG: alpha/beta fold hydrolase [Proteobacteria bacterium]|nr:alpha/beta fold hydrolase [Pseudomonadota bacterium]
MNKQTLILVPGLLCDGAVWEAQIAALADKWDLQVPNHGTADTLGAMAEAILASAPPRFALAGHSMGGRVALEVWARAPQRVTRLALLDTGYEGLAGGEAGERERAGRLRLLEVAQREGMRPMALAWARGMVHPDRLADAALMESIHAMLERSNPLVFAAQINALLNRPDRTALLPTINVPTLVLCGREDSWSTLERHQAMAAQIAGSVLVDVPDCGHMCTMEQPEALSQALRAWLDDLAQR